MTYSDPHVPTLPRMRHHTLRQDSRTLTPDFLESQDCVLLITDHSAFDYDFIVQNSRLFVDTRNATAGCEAGDCRIVKASRPVAQASACARITS